MPTRRALLISGAYFPPQTGGISRLLDRVATLLGPTQVSVLTGTKAANSSTDLHVRRVPSLFSGNRLVKAVAWVRTLPIILATERPDLILLGSVDDANLGLWLHDVMKFPFILFAYGNEVLTTIDGSYEKGRTAFKVANHVVTCSQYSASLTCKAGTPENRVSVLYPRCEPEIFRPFSVSADFRREVLGDKPAETKIILSVGNLVARKGHDVVIRSLKELTPKVPDLLYLIIGDGPHRTELQELARGLDVARSVKFVGRVPDGDLPLYYNVCDVFVMASRAQLDQSDVEGFGIVFLEANGCGKPVVGGRSGGVTEAVHEGVSGLLADPESPVDVANALARLLTDPDLAQRLGQQGRDRVIRDFGWDSYRESLLTIMSTARTEGPH
jgi:phosphatidylinositol alpha-1,6-mannosyltransferase